THPVSGTTASILIETPRTTVADLSARVSILQNTLITDGNDEPLSGALTASVIHFSGGNTEALQSFPGGLTAQLTGGSGGIEEGPFITAGFVSIEIRDESGKQAERFDPPIVVTMELTSGQTDSTGKRIVTGDIVPIWSYDEQTGRWKQEGKGIISGPNSNGRLYVEYTVRHLSFWQLGWFMRNHCLKSRKIVLDGWPEEYGGVYLTFSAAGYWRDTHVWGNNWTYLFHAPGFPVTIGAYAGGPRGTFLGSWTGRRLCEGGDLILPVQIPAALQNRMGKRIIHVSGICPGQERLDVRPTVPIWYRKETEANWTYAGMLKDGVLTINGLIFGQKYLFATRYEGQWYEAGFEINSDSTLLIPEYSDRIHLDQIDGNHIYYSVDLPDSICDELNR
ncbi:MAG TPA: hypothetical protein ENN17_05010, partial [bacterium]|nr:hypothetical protein [bacterium]